MDLRYEKHGWSTLPHHVIYLERERDMWRYKTLVDAPNMVRQQTQMNFKRLSLTDIKIDIQRVPKKRTLTKAMDAVDIENKLVNSSWGR